MKLLGLNKYQWIGSIGFMIAGGFLVRAEQSNSILYLLISSVFGLIANYYAWHKNSR